MNLIERLGGHEAAKAEGEKWGFDDFLNNQLLEYRRQHNIYEVGDYYVYLYEWDSDLDIVCKFNPSEWSDHLWNIKNMIRHADDAEIAAGKRLEVK